MHASLKFLPANDNGFIFFFYFWFFKVQIIIPKKKILYDIWKCMEIIRLGENLY